MSCACRQGGWQHESVIYQGLHHHGGIFIVVLHHLKGRADELMQSRFVSYADMSNPREKKFPWLLRLGARWQSLIKRAYSMAAHER